MYLLRPIPFAVDVFAATERMNISCHLMYHIVCRIPESFLSTQLFFGTALHKNENCMLRTDDARRDTYGFAVHASGGQPLNFDVPTSRVCPASIVSSRMVAA